MSDYYGNSYSDSIRGSDSLPLGEGDSMNPEPIVLAWLGQTETDRMEDISIEIYEFLRELER